MSYQNNKINDVNNATNSYRQPILSGLYNQEIATVDAETIVKTENLTITGWGEMEIHYTSENERNVSDMLVELGRESYFSTFANKSEIRKEQTKKQNMYEVLGDDYYNMCVSYYKHVLYDTFVENNSKNKNNENTINNSKNEKKNKITELTELSEKIEPSITIQKTATQIKKEKQEAKNAKKNKQDNMKKEDKIRLENTNNKVKEYFEIIRDKENKGEGDNLNLEKNKNRLEWFPNLLINNKILELKGLTWLLFGTLLANNVENYTTEKNLPVALSMITGMIRFVDACEKDGKLISAVNVVNKSKTCEISHTLLKQIRQWIDYLIPNYEKGSNGIYPYNGITICTYARHLLATTDFPNAIPSHGIVPREFQKKVMTECAKHYKTGYFYGLNPTIGVGKTSLVLAYASFLVTMRENSKGKHFAIYSCDTDAVRKQIGVYLFNAHIPFAVATILKDIKEKKLRVNVVPHNNCQNKGEDAAIIIICDTHTAKVYLDYLRSYEEDKFNDCTLLLDEPTNGADIKGSAMLDNVCEILTLLPLRSMLISATLPKFEEIPTIIDRVMTTNYNCDIQTITSDEVQIGCSVYTMDKIYVTPFSGCKTKESIKHAINIVSTNPFLNRLCTIEVVMMLWEKMRDAKVENLEDLRITFSNPKNMSPSAVNKTCIRFLEKLSEQSNEIIEMVCSSTINTKENMIIDNENEDEDELFTFESNDLNKNKSIDYFELGTSHATKFKSQTLIAVGDPIKFCNEYFGRLFRDVINSPAYPDDETRGKFGSIKNAVRRYKTELATYQAKLISIEKNTEGTINKSKIIQEFEEMKPNLNFPKRCVINSKEHCAFYGLGEKIKFGYEKRPFTIDEINADEMNTPDWIITLLCCGIGIYAEHNNMLCATYKTAVNKLGAAGKLTYVIADDTICYGTNWPFVFVILDETFLNVNATLKNKTIVQVKRSINTVMQLLGRAGRYLKSWEAIAYVINEVANMIIKYSQDKNYPHDEAKNIEEIFQIKLDKYFESLEANVNETKKIKKINNNKPQSGITVINPSKKNKEQIDTTNENENETISENDDENDVKIMTNISQKFMKTEIIQMSSTIVDLNKNIANTTIKSLSKEIIIDQNKNIKAKSEYVKIEKSESYDRKSNWRNNDENKKSKISEPWERTQYKHKPEITNDMRNREEIKEKEEKKEKPTKSRFSRNEEMSTFQKNKQFGKQNDKKDNDKSESWRR